MDESARGLRVDCRDQGSCANDIHDAREIVGEHTERHSPGGKILLGCKKLPQLRGRFYLIPVVVAAFDDHRPLAAVPVPAAMPTAVVVTELGACTAKFPTFTELAPITVAADPNANAKVLRAGYGRCRNGNSRERSKRKTKLSHVQSSRSCPRENGGTESLFLR